MRRLRAHGCYNDTVNEALLVLGALIDLGVVYLAYRYGREWVYATIIVNLLLISLFGAKLITVFGYVTNTGNVFYAAAFFAVYLLLGRSIAEGVRGVWIGALSIAFFVVLVQGIILLDPIPESLEIARALDLLLASATRIAVASVIAFLIAQYVNILFFTFWNEQENGVHWWFRAVVVVMVAQLIDSVIFFSIAFLGTVPTDIAAQSMITGYLIKIAIGFAAVPILYLARPRGMTLERTADGSNLAIIE